MRGVIVVETQAEYDAWISSKKPQYATVKEGAAPTAPASADSTAVATVMTNKPSAN
jgi:cytochrome c oxidase subunit 2